jgi:arylsulfatase A-like enzyme
MASRESEQPNLLFILSDDQGAWAMGCAGNEELQTPNLNRLASTGIRFDNFFCASPVCSPARASILTGQIPSQHGVQDFLREGNHPNLPNDGREIQYLAGKKAYVTVLAANGYDCGLSGKWHLGKSTLPQLGFAYWNAHAAGGGPYYGAPMVINEEFKKEERYITDVITDNAISYLETIVDTDNPFCLNVHYTAPHAPWNRSNHPRESFSSYYDSCPFDSVPWEETHPYQLNKESGAAIIGNNETSRREALSGYFSAITEMDRNIGRLIDWLEENCLRENTLLVFSSDNGMNMGHHGIWGKGNGTYPPNMYDTATKVPTIISRPGHVPQDLVCDKLLSQYDFFPTLLNYLGIPESGEENLPGRDFSPLLFGQALNNEDTVYILDEYGPTRMIRSRNWKYVHRFLNGSNEFYDLVRDPEETVNMVTAPHFQDRISNMASDLKNWYEKYVDPTMDGTLQFVTGRGQLDIIGASEKPFADDVVFFTEDNR